MWSAITATLLLFLSGANAETSLYIPAIDPQPVSVSELGVGSNGETTWRIQQGTPTGTFTDTAQFGIPGTATLVEGPTNAVLFASVSTNDLVFAFSDSCAIHNGMAACAVQISQAGSTMLSTQTETVSSLLVQGGGSPSAAASAPIPTGAPAASSPTTGASSSQPSAGPMPGSNPQATAPPKNAASRLRVAGALLGIVTLLDIVNTL